ncbi:hypothetical protein BDB00DRAFT_831698 [Zychaea mexicana]|uniref:uncharacterized protein n=1 Tax=Zychaea mexicana TaxID=64656 RepID=UPI0022FE44E6|nr:uncharacterized protein BDB00DRAFT_831698 [Zychaea mexicana]KAI9491677.1 hypothetical protein BDB00DRAFT_831698 [Zychaea mexicana]
MMSISEYRRDEMHTRASERYGPKINSVTSKQKTLFPPFNSLERTTYSQATENLAKQHHLIMRSYQSQPMTDLENYDDPKQHPKIKRNALHAYISYMIYTDLSNHQPFNGKLATPKDTPTGFAVVLNNNNNSNHSSDRSAYPFPSRTFQKMSNILSNDAQRTETTSVSSHRPLPTSTGSMPLLFNQGGNRNNTTADASHHHQVPQTSNSILHRPLTAYLRTATSQQHTERHQQREAPPVPSPEDFRPRPYASMPLLPGMPPNHGRKF